MTGGGGGAGDLRNQQKQQEQRVNQGMSMIDAIFGGGTYGTGQAKSYTPGTQYYNLQGSAIPTSFTPGYGDFSSWLGKNENENRMLQPPRQNLGPGNSGGYRSPDNTRPLNGSPFDLQGAQGAVWGDYLKSLQGQGGLYTNQVKSTGFDDAFYNRAGQAYESFALPQLNSQYQNQNSALQAQLADRGVLGGSNARMLNSSLNRETGLQKQNIANTALGMENSLRQDVGQAKNTVVNQLISSGNPQLAASQAIAASTQLAAPSPLPAIGNLFQTWANTYLGSQLNSAYGQNPYSQYARQPNPQSSGAGAGYGVVH